MSSDKTEQESRKGKVAVTAHFEPAVRQQLKLLAAEQNRKMEDVIGEAFNRLFHAYGKEKVAPSTNNDF